MSQSANDLIMGSGAPGAKFPSVGTVVKGEILETGVSQQRDYGTGELKFWSDGNPMMQAVLTIQTAERDPEITDDDGQRRLFISSRKMRDAVRDAVKTAGAKTLEVGGTITVQYTGDGEPTGNGNPPKLYRAKYEPPAAGINLEDPF